MSDTPFRISPADDGFAATWHYREPGLVLQTRWSGTGG